MFIIKIGDTSELRIAYDVIPTSDGAAFLTATADGQPQLLPLTQATIIRAPIPSFVEAAWNEVLRQDAQSQLDAQRSDA